MLFDRRQVLQSLAALCPAFWLKPTKLKPELNESIIAYTTGFPSLDRFLGGGLQLGTLTGVFGSAGVGKTEFCATIFEAQRSRLPGLGSPCRYVRGSEDLLAVWETGSLLTTNQLMYMTPAEYAMYMRERWKNGLDPAALVVTSDRRTVERIGSEPKLFDDDTVEFMKAGDNFILLERQEDEISTDCVLLRIEDHQVTGGGGFSIRFGHKGAEEIPGTDYLL